MQNKECQAETDVQQSNAADVTMSSSHNAKPLVVCRYSLYESKDLNSKLLWNGTNKAEMKKVRTGWKYQILLTNVAAEIYDNVKKEWVV